MLLLEMQGAYGEGGVPETAKNEAGKPLVFLASLHTGLGREVLWYLCRSCGDLQCTWISATARNTLPIDGDSTKDYLQKVCNAMKAGRQLLSLFLYNSYGVC